MTASAAGMETSIATSFYQLARLSVQPLLGGEGLTDDEGGIVTPGPNPVANDVVAAKRVRKGTAAGESLGTGFETSGSIGAWTGQLVTALTAISAVLPGQDPFAELDADELLLLPERLLALADTGQLHRLEPFVSWVAVSLVLPLLIGTHTRTLSDLDDPDLLSAVEQVARFIGDVQSTIVGVAQAESLDQAASLLDDLIEQWQHEIVIPQAS